MEGKDTEEWLHGVLGKVGGMWLGVCCTLRQAETVNYVESQMQMMGTDVKTFCSEFIREVFSSPSAQTVTDPVDDFLLGQITEKVQCINLTDEIPSVDIPRKDIVECTTGKEEMRVRADEPDVIVPFDYSRCQSHLTEDLGEDDLVLPDCKPKAPTCDLNVNISTSFLEKGSENEEYLDALSSSACRNGHCALKGWAITNIPDAASSSEIFDASGLSEWDGSSKEAVEQALLQDGGETMLGESCIMICSSDPCPDQDQSTKQRAYMKKLLRKLGLRVAMVKYQDCRPELNEDESCGDACSTQRMEKLPLALDTVVSSPQPREFELLEQDWEVI